MENKKKVKTEETKEKKPVNPVLAWGLIAAEAILVLVIAFLIR